MTSEIYPFIKGLKLSRLFYQEAVKPIMAEYFPSVSYSAALFGTGSEVLGYDTAQSMDHDWGPRLLLFLDSQDHIQYAHEIDIILRQQLPHSIHGIPTNLANLRSSDPQDIPPETEGRINHTVSILSPGQYFQRVLGFDVMQEISPIDWVSTPSTKLLELVSGEVFHDGLNSLCPIRERLQFYPHDVWLYLMAAQWRRIDQEEPFMGRCGQIGDDLGSRMVAIRLVRDIMRLCFLMERRYAPYIKWFGTAFTDLACAKDLLPIFEKIFSADTWQAREKVLTRSYVIIANMHNAIGITQTVEANVSSFHERPFKVIHSSRFVEAIREEITNAGVLALPEYIGSIDQFTDSTDALNYRQKIRRVFE